MELIVRCGDREERVEVTHHGTPRRAAAWSGYEVRIGVPHRDLKRPASVPAVPAAPAVPPAVPPAEPTVPADAALDDQRVAQVDYAPGGGALASLIIDGRQSEVSVRRLSNGAYQVIGRTAIHEVQVVDPLTWLAEQAHGAAGASGRQEVTAYMPGRVVAVLVEEGQEVQPGQGLVVLEAMKMENEIQAEGAGTVARLRVQPGDAVDGGAVLVEIE